MASTEFEKRREAERYLMQLADKAQKQENQWEAQVLPTALLFDCLQGKLG